MQKLPLLSFVPSFLAALAYGAVVRFFFGSILAGISSTLSVAFIVLVPFVIGMLAVYFAPAERRSSWKFSLGIATLSMLAGAVLAAVLLWEAAICVLMALPIMLVPAAVGGLAMWWLLDRRGQRSGTATLALVLFLPFLLVPFERQFPVNDSFQSVSSQIEIDADADTVWRNIVRVAPIQGSERPFSILFSFLNAPRPLQAEMSGEGVGGRRHGVFEGGLGFGETITVWEPGKRIEWEIEAEHAQGLAPPWDQIGGKPFAVPNASYRIEPTGDGRVILHLSSTHRLTTRFNEYGSLWTRWGMNEFQNYILQIIKARSELEAGN